MKNYKGGVFLEDNLKENLELKIKKILLLIASISNVVICICLNFNEILIGDPVKVKNIIVSIVYLLIWFFIIFFANKLESRKLLKVFLGFWILNFIVIILSIIIVKLDIYVFLIIPFIVISFGPLYGLDKLSTVITIMISILNCIFIYYLIRRKNAK